MGGGGPCWEELDGRDRLAVGEMGEVLRDLSSSLSLLCLLLDSGGRPMERDKGLPEGLWLILAFVTPQRLVIQ